MRSLIVIATILFLSACKTFQVNETKTIANTPSLGIEWAYSDDVNGALQPMVDSVVRKAMDDFNARNGQLKLHLKGKKDKDYISFNFSRIKKVSSGGKIAGYTISAIGLIGAPVALIASEAGFVVFFWYWPAHQIFSEADLSPNMAAEKHSRGFVNSSVGALFAGNKRQIPKMLNRYYNDLMKAFIKIETQLIQHGNATSAGK